MPASPAAARKKKPKKTGAFAGTLIARSLRHHNAGISVLASVKMTEARLRRNGHER